MGSLPRQALQDPKIRQARDRAKKKNENHSADRFTGTLAHKLHTCSLRLKVQGKRTAIGVSEGSRHLGAGIPGRTLSSGIHVVYGTSVAAMFGSLTVQALTLLTHIA